MLDEIADFQPRLQHQELYFRYGRFWGSPLVMPDKEFTRALTTMFPWYTEDRHLNLGLAGAAKVRDGGLPVRRGGRPPLAGGRIRDIVREEYGPRLAPGGDLVGEKFGFVIKDAIARVKKREGVDVNDSTMRDYLAPLRSPRADGN